MAKENVANQAAGTAGGAKGTTKEEPPFELLIVQVLGDDYYQGKSNDGTGYNLHKAPYNRGWMDRTQDRFAYRCLPLTIANQMGVWITNPVGFTARWNGNNAVKNVQVTFDSHTDKYKNLIADQFGQGIITWNNPFLIRTKPVGSRLIVIGPANQFKPFVAPLTAIIETDWIVSSFTMNWKISVPDVDIRFEVGEPIMQLIPIARNCISDMERATFRVRHFEEEREFLDSFRIWSKGRDKFHAEVRNNTNTQPWQRDYFLGRDEKETVAKTDHHHMKVVTQPFVGAGRLGLGEKWEEIPDPPPPKLDAASAPQGELIVRRISPSARLPEPSEDGFVWKLPPNATVVWDGGSEFTASVLDDPSVEEMFVPDTTKTGILLVRTGFAVQVSRDYALRVRGNGGTGSSRWRVREQILYCASGLVELVVALEFLRTEVPAALKGEVRLELTRTGQKANMREAT